MSKYDIIQAELHTAQSKTIFWKVKRHTDPLPTSDAKTPETFFAKLYCDTVDGVEVPSDLSLEKSIYYLVKRELCDTYHIPLFVQYVDQYTALDAQTLWNTFNSQDAEMSSAFIESLVGLATIKDIAKCTFGVIVTQYISGGSLLDFLKKNRRDSNEYDFLVIMAQVLFALWSLHDIGVTHNDLHPGNVLLEVLPDPINICIEVQVDKSRRVSLPMRSKYLVKVFDFDRAEHCDPIQYQRNKWYAKHEKHTVEGGLRCSLDPERDIAKWIGQVSSDMVNKFKYAGRVLGFASLSRVKMLSWLKDAMVLAVGRPKAHLSDEHVLHLWCMNGTYDRALLEYRRALREGVAEKDEPKMPSKYHSVQIEPGWLRPRANGSIRDYLARSTVRRVSEAVPDDVERQYRYLDLDEYKRNEYYEKYAKWYRNGRAQFNLDRKKKTRTIPAVSKRVAVAERTVVAHRPALTTTRRCGHRF